MELLPIDQLIVPENRQRREFDEKRLKELAESIRSKGLLHPLVVRSDRKTLVAGERRLRVISELHRTATPFDCGGATVERGMVPVVNLGELGEFEVREAELEENIIRTDLTWQERNAAIAALHRLREEQNPQQSKTATAREVSDSEGGGKVSVVTNALILDKFKDDKEVQSAPTQKDALRIARKKIEREFRAMLPVESHPDHQILHGDMQEKIKGLPDGMFDCVLTDPPYGVEADTLDESQVQVSHDYEDSWDGWSDLMATLAVESYRVTKPGAHIYVFCSLQRWHELPGLFEAAGWKPFKTPLIWFKPNSGVVPWAGHGPRCNTEGIFYANKGWRPTLKAGSDLLQFAQVHDEQHAAKKPTDLYKELLERSCYPGDLVLDPFCGAGTIFQAAQKLRMKATGIEKDKDHFNLAMSRMGGGSEEA